MLHFLQYARFPAWVRYPDTDFNASRSGSEGRPNFLLSVRLRYGVYGINKYMNLSRIALVTAAAGFAGFGIACLIRPKNMLNRVDVRAKSARGTTELRAMYGGLELGLGAFFAAAAARPEWSSPALLAQTLGLGSLAASRLVGILADHPRGALMKLLFIAESIQRIILHI